MNKRNSRFTDCMDFERFTGADYLESRNLVAYACAKLMLRDLTDGSEKQITAGGQGEGNPRFSPDGSRLLFLSSGKAGRQLYIYDLETEEVRQVTQGSRPVMDPVWSPDGRRILFASPAGGSGAPKKQHDDEAVAIEDFGYKFDGIGFYRPDSYMHLFVVSASGGEIEQITDGQYNYMHHNWTADSRSVICCSNRFRGNEQTLGMDLLLIEAKEKGEMKRLTEDLWMVSYPNPMRPVAAPDGKSVIAGCLDMPENADLNGEEMTYPEVYLYRIALDGSGAKRIFIPSDTCYQCVQFPYNAFCGWGLEKLQLTEDGKTAVFHGGWQGRTVLYKLDITGEDAKMAETVFSEKKTINGISRIQNGKVLAAISEPAVPERYIIIDINSGERMETGIQSSAKLLQEVAFSQTEDFFVDTLDGDSRVHCWVMPPQDFDPQKTYPAILYIHGGPHPFYTYGFTHEHQCFAGAGYAVICCNPRGSSSYGLVHQDIEKAFDGRAYEDCLQAVDEACRRFSWIDGQRIGVTGGSYGGYMVNYMATHSKRFKAYITQRSITNEMISYASSDMQGSSKKYANFEEFMMVQLKKSPVAYAERIDRPLLILHGTDDMRTPVEGAHQLFVAVKDLHPELPVKMVLYPHTPHDQPNDPKQLQHYYNEMLAWFDTYL